MIVNSMFVKFFIEFLRVRVDIIVLVVLVGVVVSVSFVS